MSLDNLEDITFSICGICTFILCSVLCLSASVGIIALVLSFLFGCF